MSGIQIDDIFWPGDSPTPPRGRPDKYKLKVVTLDEDPYVKYSPPDPKTGTCPPNSYPCRMKSENISRSVPTARRQQVSALSRTSAGQCLQPNVSRSVPAAKRQQVSARSRTSAGQCPQPNVSRSVPSAKRQQVSAHSRTSASQCPQPNVSWSVPAAKRQHVSVHNRTSAGQCP